MTRKSSLSLHVELILTFLCIGSLLVVYIQTGTNQYLNNQTTTYHRRESEQNRNLLSKARRAELEDNLYSTDAGCISRKHKLLYVHIPKTGGTTIERSPLFDDTRERHATGGHHTIDAMMKDADVRGIESYVKAAHIRHPCERFISAFNYLKHGGNKGDQKWAAAHIGDMTIDEFVMSMDESGWKEATAAHFRPQFVYVFHKDGRNGVDTLLCQEHWDEGIRRLFDRVGEMVPSYLLHSTSSEEKSTKEKNKSHALQLSHETCADLKQETRNALERRYAMDYCLFDYPSLPDPQGTCVGISKTPKELTDKFPVCKTMVNVLLGLNK